MMCLLRELGNYLACVHWRDILAFSKLKLYLYYISYITPWSLDCPMQ